MKIFLLCDYFYPFNPGGSEWSVLELAKSLKNNKVEPIIITLNYGAKEKETIEGIKVHRLPFIKKLENDRKTVNPIWQNNPFFFISSTNHLLKLIRREKPSILHTHGKFLIPATIISGYLTKTPVIVSSRDKQIICSIGKCFFVPNRKKGCSFLEYVFSDIPWFYKNYIVNKTPWSFVYITTGSIYNRIFFYFIKLLAKRADALIAISRSQKDYLEANGFSNVQVIYNTQVFKIPKSKVQTRKSILFAGKLSKGKGGEVLIKTVMRMVKKSGITFIFAGSIDLQKLVSESMENEFFKKSTKFLGNVKHSKLINLYAQVSSIVMPSVYPESFGRIAMESISQGTPAIVSKIGALPEVVEDKVTGRVIDPNEDQLEEAILEVVKNEKYYKQNIRKAFPKLKYKFQDNPIKEHLRLYKSLIK